MTNFQTFKNSQLWFVTGKGGVGKTTVVAALGLLCAEKGFKTLLVETHGLNHLAKLFEVEEAGYQGKKIRKNLSLLQVTPEKALEEYLLQQVRFKFIYQSLFNNNYVRHFLDAAPGLLELLTIGKIWDLADGTASSRQKSHPHYDLVIVDAPSTGHALSLLTIPKVVDEAVKLGPLKKKAESILNFLQDGDRTKIWMVTLAEDMPANEAIELSKKLHEEVNVHLEAIFVNSMWPQLISEKTFAEFKKLKIKSSLLDFYQSHYEQNQHYLNLLQKKLLHDSLFSLPLLPQKNSNELEIAKALSHELSSLLSE